MFADSCVIEGRPHPSLHSVPHFIKSCANFVVLVDNTSPIEKYHWEGPLGWEQSARCRLERLAALVPLQLHWHGQLLKVRALLRVARRRYARAAPLGAYLAGGEGQLWTSQPARKRQHHRQQLHRHRRRERKRQRHIARGNHRSGAEKEDPDDHVIHLAGLTTLSSKSFGAS